MSLETMTKLSTVTVGAGGSASISFSNIPQGYTDLKLAISIRSSTNANPSFYLVVNGNSDNVYSIRRLLGTGAAALSTSLSTTFFRLDGGANGTGETASTFSSIDICASNYSGNAFKTFSFESVVESNATLVNSYLASGLWSNPSPITSLTVVIDGTIAQNSTATLYGIKNARQTAGNSIKATGGNISFDGTYVYHVFPTTGTFTPSQSLIADYLVVAGGGGGGAYIGAGGGAGGLRSTLDATGGGGAVESKLSLSPTSYSVTVGAGGAAGAYSGLVAPGSGSDSSFSTITSTGGGRGGHVYSTAAGGTGGSGGGGAGGGDVTTAGGSGTTGQGYAGGTKSGPNDAGAGGGGAGAVGASRTNASDGQGGVGVYLPSFSLTTGAGVSGYFAGGGGSGFANSGGVFTSGGLGGGGNGGRNTGSVAATAGTANTGGGGGGTGLSNGDGGAGGSGIVIIRYKG
jgi:hypothetical protein